MEIGPLERTVDGYIEKNVVFRKQADSSFGLGLSAAVLSLLPFGFAGDRQKDRTHQYEIEKVEGRTFLPSYEYVQRSVLQPEVLDYLARHRYRKSLYMIVGIKIGYNAEIIHERKYKRGGGLNVSIPGAMTGVPLDLGANLKQKAINHRYEKKSIPNSFVFAYRLREVRYFKKDNSITDVEFTKGAELHDLNGKVGHVALQARFKDKTYLGTEDEIDVDGIVGEDYEEDEYDAMIVDGCIMIGPQVP